MSTLDRSPKPHTPFVPASAKMTEFTWRAVLLGLIAVRRFQQLVQMRSGDEP